MPVLFDNAQTPLVRFVSKFVEIVVHLVTTKPQQIEIPVVQFELNTTVATRQDNIQRIGRQPIVLQQETTNRQCSQNTKRRTTDAATSVTGE